MRTVRTFVEQAEISITARKRAYMRPQGRKKTPGNDNLSIITPRHFSIEFIANT